MSETAPAKPPRKWLGRNGGWWILLIGGGVLTGFLIYDAIIGGTTPSYRSLPMTSLVIGSFLAVVGIFYSMLYRLRPTDGVTPALLFGALAVSAIGTTFVASRVEGYIADGLAVPLHNAANWGLAELTLFAGPVEESLKLITVILIGLAVKTKTFRGGLFLGGTVGLGFAAMENLLYLTNTWEHPLANYGQVGSLAFITVSRTIITPLLHPIFTSLAGGMLFAGVRNGRYRVTVPLVGTFFAVMGVHSLWDFGAASLGAIRGHVPTTAFGFLTLLALLGAVGILVGLPLAWRAVARHADVLAGFRPPRPLYTYPAAPPPPPS